ncbi:MAG TPA: sugar ABC transporter ATP-binding protein [Chloroflexi bacterium]|nr:sugar ABC transporter ATP-binding protein [Chloroflexota bacterium]
MTEQPLLSMHGINKSYYGTQVLQDIDLTLRAGEIHAIVGENGAGKSTLMNILFGMPVIHETGGYQGEILFEGQRADILSPHMAMELGIGMVHQEFMLLPEYTITENIKLNREILKDNPLSRIFGEQLKLLDVKAMRADARRALDSLDIGIEEYVKVAGLPVGYMQFTEIAREIDKTNIKLIVFDEPTAVLAESEAAHLLEAMQRIAAQGIAILFITHRLDEVMEVAENITVLRDGRLVATKSREETSIYELAELMVGRKIEKLSLRAEQPSNGKVALSIRDLVVEMPGEEVKRLDLEVRQGEILGIGGLAGQGKVGIANGIMGLYPARGTVQVNGSPLQLNDTPTSIARGLAFVSEDRRGVGLLLDASIEMNIAITAMQNQDRFIRKFGFLTQIDGRAMREHASKMIEDLDIRCTGPTQIVRRLSGGNQQKVCVARALTLEPEILFVSEPTRGIDVGAKRLVLETLIQLNTEEGMTIVMTSSELGELRSVCDRIAIISEGQLAGILKPDDSDVDFGLLMAGQKKQARSIGHG